jgi:integrase/recombinase XerD
VTEASLLLDRFAAYLTVERGLAPTTVTLNIRLARPFLQQRALERGGRLDLEQLTAAEVRAFVLDQARKQPRSAKRIVTAQRSLLRFLHVDGILAVPLAGAVPSPAGHSLAGLPRALEPGQAEAMLASCDPATATGRSCCCCPGWGCGPARSRDSAWTGDPPSVPAHRRAPAVRGRVRCPS